MYFKQEMDQMGRKVGCGERKWVGYDEKCLGKSIKRYQDC